MSNEKINNEVSAGSITKGQRFKQNAKRFMNEKMIPVMGKLANQRHLSSIRDGFAILLPMIITSSLAIIILTTIFGGWGTAGSSLLGAIAKWSGNMVKSEAGTWSFIAGSNFEKVAGVASAIFGAMNNIGLGVLSIYFAFTLSFFLAKSRGNDTPEIAGLLGLGCFFIATIGGASSTSFTYLNDDGVEVTSKLTEGGFLGSGGLFISIVVCILATELFCWFSKNPKFKLSMPDGVPPSVARAFNKLIPVILTGFAITGLLAIVVVPTYFTEAPVIVSRNVAGKVKIITQDVNPGSFWNLGDLIYMGIQIPFIYIAGSGAGEFAIMLIAMFLMGFLWFFGIHGSNVVSGIFAPVWYMLLAENLLLFQTSGIDALVKEGHIFVNGFWDAFIMIGGFGATLPLILSTKIFSKREDEKEIATFALPSGAFNINEPITFGYPLVLNPIYAVPFIFTPFILTIFTFIFYKIFNAVPIFAQIPWTAPAGVGALFGTGFDWRAPVIVFLNAAIAFAIWTPFVIMSSRSYVKQQKVQEQATAQANLQINGSEQQGGQ